jgi:hypothetical protein
VGIVLHAALAASAYLQLPSEGTTSAKVSQIDRS